MSATQELLALLSVPVSSPRAQSASQTSYHQAIQALRDSGDTSFLFLRTLLEITSADASTRKNLQHQELLFHCILGFRHVSLYRWTRYSLDFKTAVRDFLLSLGLNLLREEHTSTIDSLVSKTVANASLASSAAFWKRMWRNPDQDNAPNASEEEAHLLQSMTSHPFLLVHRFQSCDELFQATESLVNQPLTVSSEEPTRLKQCNMATRASEFLSSLVGEFSGSSGAAQFNSSLEFHRLAHLAFEEKGLVQSLQIGMGGLGRIVPTLAQDSSLLDLASSIVSLTTDVLSWEFGSSGGRWVTSGGGYSPGSSGLVRPPESWRQYLVRPDFLGAVFQVYNSIRGSTGGVNGGYAKLKHLLRQLLLLLSSITGPIFEDKSQRLAYSGFLADGCLSVLSLLSNELGSIASISLEQAEHLERETVDMCSMISRLVTNFRIEGLSQLPNFSTLLTAIATVGDILLKQNVEELRKVQGDIESVEGIEWRDESINLLLEAIVLLADDHWLLGKRQGNMQDLASIAMASAISPLYQSYVTSRIEMAKMEEHYITVNAADLDEIREEIVGTAFEEELTAASSLGRINILSSLSCLSSLFQVCLPRLQELFNIEATDVTPEAAVLLEEARVLIMCICHLLTDDSIGETPLIPEGILDACSPPSISSTDIKRGSKDYANTTSIITQLVTSLMGVAELQASKIAANAYNPHLSPLLATTLLNFFNRWAPAYILPSNYDYDSSHCSGESNGIISTWRSVDTCKQALAFCVTLCLHYHCYWPHENQVQEGSAQLLMNLAKRNKEIRNHLMQAPMMEKLVALNIATSQMTHSSVNDAAGSNILSKDMIDKFKRVPYKYRAQILTSTIVASSEVGDPIADRVLNESLQAVQNAFSMLVQGFETKRFRADDIATREIVCLCVELYGGVARASEMCHPERIPIFITPSLQQLSGLMAYYASDLTICELLLQVFKDYTEQFIAMLGREQCLTVFRASAELLKQYSTNHCSSRVINKKGTVADLEEEQNFNDVLCAIQLLINLGAKDFIDTFSTNANGGSGIKSDEVTEIIFFGLQQILPLMTQGLLHFPSLCKQYFSLVGFMMDTYPNKLGLLPSDLFNGLLESLMFGMSHTDSFVSKSSLQGISALAREQIENQTLNVHLKTSPQLFDNCCQKLLKDVVFQSIIWDRLEPAATALLPLAAVDMTKFASLVNTISQQLDTFEKQQRLQAAFQRLMQPEVVSKVANGNYGGRQNKLRFKKDFEVFVKEIHSAVLVF